MRQIATSGGIAYGNQEQELDCIPVGWQRALRTSDLGLPTAPLVFLTNASNARYDRDTRRVIEGMRMYPDRNIIAFSALGEPTILYRLRWQKKETPVQALEGILKTELEQGGEIPTWLVSLLYIASRLYERAAPEHIQLSINILAQLEKELGHDYKFVTDAAVLQESEINHFAHKAIFEAAENGNIVVPSCPLDRGRFLFALSRALWDPDIGRQVREKIVDPIHKTPANQGMIGKLVPLGAFWLWPLISPPRIGGAKIDAADSPPGAYITFWLQWLALLDASENEARHLLIPFAPRLPGDALIEEPEKYKKYTPPPVPDSALALALARQLVKEAEENKAYVPYGVFDVVLPKDLPVTDWGIYKMRLVILNPHRHWVALFNEKGETLTAFPWSREGISPYGSLVLHEWARPTIDLMVSALWRDLCVAGPVVVPSERKSENISYERSTTRHHDARAQETAESYTKSKTARLLPAATKIWIAKGNETRVWANEEEQEIIRRTISQVCAVRGHYRRHEYAGDKRDDPRERAKAESLRQAAAARAAQFGLPAPPQGYTFVSPFVRGGNKDKQGQGDNPIAQVKARGLIALSGILNTAIKENDGDKYTYQSR